MRFPLLVLLNKRSDIITDTTVDTSGNLLVHELLHAFGKRDIDCFHGLLFLHIINCLSVLADLDAFSRQPLHAAILDVRSDLVRRVVVHNDFPTATSAAPQYSVA